METCSRLVTRRDNGLEGGVKNCECKTDSVLFIFHDVLGFSFLNLHTQEGLLIEPAQRSVRHLQRGQRCRVRDGSGTFKALQQHKKTVWEPAAASTELSPELLGDTCHYETEGVGES